ncbi:MAG: heavy metal translocating P-type ATPase metal-binding domain-containing protein [Opitutaceae bacterium]|jgi:Cu2+-exporting ATPase|nr:heavy metal translocating P-type ATPase metal-binding domain-containing protein [Opitutaceae bacterium]
MKTVSESFASPPPAAAAVPPKTARPVCAHCGVPVAPGERFCCAGCAFVYRLVLEEGLDAFYKIRDAVTTPADAVLQPERDFAWLAGEQRAVEERQAGGGGGRTAAAEQVCELVVAIQGISCAGCVWLIERLFAKQPGAGRIDINAQTGLGRMRWARGSGAGRERDGRRGAKGSFDAAAFARVLQKFNYLVGPADLARMATTESRGLVKRVGLCVAFSMNVMLFTLPAYFGMKSGGGGGGDYTRLFETLSMLFATASLAAGGGYFLRRAVHALRERMLHIDLPIALGIAGSWAGSMYGWVTANPACQYFDFVSGFILLMLIGRWAQVVAVERNQRRLLREQPLAVRVSVVRADGTVTDVAPESIRVDDTLEIGSGHVAPVEARLLADEATFNLAWITGETEPQVFRQGQRVPAGATCVSRARIRLAAVQGWAGSLLARLMQQPERAPARDRLIERVIQGYLVAIIGTAIAAGAVWWWRTGGDIPATGAVVVAILVVSCPCALGLAFPLAEEIATVALRRRGVFIKERDVWTRLSRVRMLAFDKTGTLTLETPVLQNPEALDALEKDAVTAATVATGSGGGITSGEARAALVALVRDNLHPVGRALHEAVLLRGWHDALPGEVGEVTGQGVVLGEWILGRAPALPPARMASPGGAPAAAAAPDRADVILAKAGREVARFRFADEARADAREELAALRARGLGVAVLSGDRPEKVAALARDLGLPEETAALGGLSPEEKAAWVERHAPADTLMLGDGANDSLAFDRALCRGTPVVHRGVLGQKADFYYLGRGIGGIRALLEMNDARHRTHLALLVFMVLYNLVTVGLAATGHMNPLFAAVLMPLSSLATLAIVAAMLRPGSPSPVLPGNSGNFGS